MANERRPFLYRTGRSSSRDVVVMGFDAEKALFPDELPKASNSCGREPLHRYWRVRKKKNTLTRAAMLKFLFPSVRIKNIIHRMMRTYYCRSLAGNEKHGGRQIRGLLRRAAACRRTSRTISESAARRTRQSVRRHYGQLLPVVI